MKLSENELDIIACMAFNASLSVAEVSASTGIKEHVVRHALKKLLDSGTLQLRPYVNPYALGFMEFYAEVVVETPGQAAITSLINAFVDAPSTTFVCEAAGDVHLCIMFLTQTLAEVPLFFEEICLKVPDIKFRKYISPVIQVTVAHPRHGGASAKNNVVCYNAEAKSVRFDALDAKILLSLGSEKITSRRELSLKCGIPPSTLEYRLQTLQQRGILLALGYVIPNYRDGLSRYNLRITASKPSKELRALVSELAGVHPAVRCVIQLAGLFDYLIDVRLPHPGLITAFTQELHRHLAPYISKIEILPELSTHKLYVNPDDFDLFSSIYEEGAKQNLSSPTSK